MGVANYYFDPSALFKRYIFEHGTELVDRIFSVAKAIYISNLTIVELISNLKRMNEVDQSMEASTFTAIKNQFFKDIDESIITIIPLNSPIIIDAVNLIQGTYITPIDSLQLATAVALKKKLDEIGFVCADRKLSILARQEDLEVIHID